MDSIYNDVTYGNNKTTFEPDKNWIEMPEASKLSLKRVNNADTDDDNDNDGREINQGRNIDDINPFLFEFTPSQHSLDRNDENCGHWGNNGNWHEDVSGVLNYCDTLTMEFRVNQV